MAVKFLEMIEQQMRNLQIRSRAELADRMNKVDGSSGDWDKAKVDKIMNNRNCCPRTETCATMKLAVGYGDFTPDVYRSDKSDE